LLAGLIAIYAIRQFPGHPVPAATVTPLTTTPGNEVQPSLSPDGNEVAFAYNDGHSPSNHIVLKSIGSEELIRLTSDSTNDVSPSWSPDGQNIAFLRFVSDQSVRLMIIPSIGGAERELAKLQVDPTESEIRVAWSPDGKWIATSEAEKPNSPMALVLISTLTGEKRRLIYQPATVDADLSPSFSPDGRYLAFARHLGPHTADIYVLELPQEGLIAAEARRLTNSTRMNTSPFWTVDGQNIIFVGYLSHVGFQIWKIPAFRAADAILLNEIGQDISSIALSPRTNRLVYARNMEDQNIWSIKLDSASPPPAHRRAVSQGQLIASTRQDLNPQYSPDGKYIAFQSDRSGDCEIWIAKSDGSSLRQMTRLHAEVSGFARWSPDGKYIVFHSRLNGFANLFVVNVETGDYRKLTTGTTNDTAPTWSHDGRWIYFESEREDGVQIWRIPAAGGPASRLTKTTGVVALESVDGKLLYYSKVSEPGLWSMPVEGGPESQVLPSLYGVDNFAVTKEGIYFVRGAQNSEAVISFMSFSSRTIEDLATVKLPVGRGLTVSPDGNSILFTQFDRADSDLYLVDNFKP
jgi:Tol biopolymer transport system component